ncbi:lipoprotein [Escherichia coli]|uniref:Lipoprotein n=12 Tax=Enterobacterales TaxID=91347 RepID=A0A376LDA3_ECOLX|nr:lipoprotein [Escherichia coli]
MKRLIPVALLTALLAGCAHDSPCVPVYDDQGRLVHTNTCMKGTTQDNWETAGAIAGGAAAVAGLTMGIIALSEITEQSAEYRALFNDTVSHHKIKYCYILLANSLLI